MTERYSNDDRGVQFSAVLTPHRSLGPRAFVLLMVAIGGISFIAGVYFYSIGAWPVMGFFGLDALLIYAAFKLNYRDGRMYEVVELDRHRLVVQRFSPSGREQRWEFNPYWARIDVAEMARGQQELRLASHGDELVFGRFLTPDEKHDFAAALGDALRDNRGGRRI